MSTVWWLTVLALTALAAFGLGWFVRSQRDLYFRATYGETLDFTRKRIGA